MGSLGTSDDGSAVASAGGLFSRGAALFSRLPIGSWLPQYQRAWLRGDTIAAFAVWAVLVPEGMAYATLAGLPPEAGLYAALPPLLLYAILGTSRELTIGPSSAVAALSAATVAPLAAGAPAKFIALSAALALFVGFTLLAAGLARLGFVAEFLARPVLTGFVTGLALVIGLGQAPKLLGVEKESGDFFEQLWGLAHELGNTKLLTFAIGAAALGLLFTLPLLLPKAPSALAVVALGLVGSTAFHLEGHDVAVVGDIAAGLPSLGFPNVGFDELLALIPGVLGLALLSFSESIAGARAFAAQHGYEVDANRELAALGASNVGTGLAQGFVVDASLSRTAVADAAGVRTQMASLFNFALVAVTIVALTPLFHNLPEAVLGAIVIAAVTHLVHFDEFQHLFRVDRQDLLLALVSFLGVLVFGILPGLLVAVGASLVALVYRAYRPASAVLGRVPGGRDVDETYRFRDIAEHPEYDTFPGLVIFRFGNELFFANSNGFRTRIRELAREADPPAREVLVDAGAISYADTTATAMLAQLCKELRDENVALAFARVKTPLLQILRRSGVEEQVGRERIYESVRAGVDDYLRHLPPVEQRIPRQRERASS